MWNTLETGQKRAKDINQEGGHAEGGRAGLKRQSGERPGARGKAARAVGMGVLLEELERLSHKVKRCSN